MSTVTVHHPRLELSSWVGMIAGMIATWIGLQLLHAPIVGYAALTPDEFTAWVGAGCAAVGAITTAANGVAAFIHRLRKWRDTPRKPRKPRKPKVTLDAPSA
jgi:hypothetical protein